MTEAAKPAHTAVLLLNLGTPASPEVPDVRRYLAEFLSDPRVLDMHPVARWLLLHGIILRTRPRKSAEAYRQIWSDEGSPLLIESERLLAGVSAELGDGYRVALAMRYGEPSIASVLPGLLADAPERLWVAPLYPQYASAATGSSLTRVFEVLAELSLDARPEVRTLPAFYDEPGWLDSWRALGAEALRDFAPDHVLFSYHGLPERQVKALDASGAHCLTRDGCCDAIGSYNRGCYRAQCFATSRGLVRVLGLEGRSHSTSFQSRLGSTPWIRPYTDEVLEDLARAGVKRLAVLCPAFVADCLETLEEIDIRLREQWRELGGEALLRLPCPNAHPRFVRAVADQLRSLAPAPAPGGQAAETG
jgi:ferrochelatase